MTKKIAIIGAGPAGLASAKSCLELGLEPTVFEKSKNLGGVWSGTGPAWDGMHTNLSKWSCMFSDFPHAQNTQDFPLESEMHNYLQLYSDYFEITNKIHFEETVLNISKKGNIWTIETSDDTYCFDKVIITSGFFSPPVTKHNNTNIVHSAYASPHQTNPNQTITIIGGSFSGYELAAEFAKKSNQPVNHIINRPAWILNRYLQTEENDRLPIDLFFYSRKDNQQSEVLLPKEKRARIVQFFSNKIGNPGKIHKSLTTSENPDDMVLSVVSDDYLSLVQDGKINPIQGLAKEFNRQSINIETKNLQNITLKTNLTVLATGFSPSLPFLNPELKKIISFDNTDKFMPALLYKSVWPKDLEGIAFVGFYRGPYFATIELQARWVAGVFSGGLPHPKEDEINNGITESRSLRLQNPRPQFPYANYVEFADGLATKARCYPNLNEDDPLFLPIHEGFFLPSHYRVNENYDFVKNLIESIPYKHE